MPSYIQKETDSWNLFYNNAKDVLNITEDNLVDLQVIWNILLNKFEDSSLLVYPYVSGLSEFNGVGGFQLGWNFENAVFFFEILDLNNPEKNDWFFCDRVNNVSEGNIIDFDDPLMWECLVKTLKVASEECGLVFKKEI